MNYITKYYQRLKTWHAREVELGPTEKDERYHVEVKPLTEEQREQLEAEYVEMRKRMAGDSRREREIFKRYWEDKTNEDVN